MTSREKFEAWAELEELSLAYGDCGYVYSSTEMAWRAWQASEAAMAVQLANAESKCRELAADNAVKHKFIKTCFRAAADGASMDGDDIQKLGERLGLFGREIYQPVLHAYICGHEAGEDTVYVMKKTPKTDAFLAEVRASARDNFIGRIEWIIRNECNPDKTEAIISELQKFSDELKLEAAQ